jgi:hypothetical protein
MPRLSPSTGKSLPCAPTTSETCNKSFVVLLMQAMRVIE